MAIAVSGASRAQSTWRSWGAAALLSSGSASELNMGQPSSECGTGPVGTGMGEWGRGGAVSLRDAGSTLSCSFSFMPVWSWGVSQEPSQLCSRYKFSRCLRPAVLCGSACCLGCCCIQSL